MRGQCLSLRTAPALCDRRRITFSGSPVYLSIRMAETSITAVLKIVQYKFSHDFTKTDFVN